MKKYLIFTISFFIILTIITACSNDTEIQICSEIRNFSYNEDFKMYADDFARTDGFKNIIESPISSKEDAIELAKIELFDKFEYNQIIVYYDESSDIWLVLFHTREVAGGCLSVYMDGNGLTKLIVAGE